MEYTQESLLNLELRKTNKKGKNKRFIEKLYEHKWMSMIVISVMILSTINAIMIYNFFKILQNI